MLAEEMKHVFVTVIEVRPLEGCQLDPSEYDGAAARCYIDATDEPTAKKLLSDSLEEDRLELVEIEFFVRHDLTDWENPNSQEAAAAIALAKSSGEVVYSEFHAWDHADPDSRKNQTGDKVM